MTVSLNCRFFTEEDKHPEVIDFEEVIKDKNYFEPIYEKHDPYSGDIFLLKTYKFLVVNQYYEKIESYDNSAKQITDDLITNLELRDLNGKLIFSRTLENESYFVDNKGNLYVENFQYSAPDYIQKKIFPMVNIEDSLYWFHQKNTNVYNTDSLNSVYLKEAEKEYGFKYSDTLRYAISQDKLILFTNLKATDQSQLKRINLKEFDEKALIDVRSTGRLDFGTSFYYHYFQIGDLKFKYSDDENGFEVPETFIYKGKTYLFHDRLGIYKLK